MAFDPFSRLNYREYDFPRRTRQPAMHYIIAACHRSGSSLLAMKLWETGVAGAPWEYFNELFSIRPLAARFGARDPEHYVRSLYQYRTSTNGVFGVKIQLTQWQPSETYRRLLTSARRRVQVVFTTRQDRVAQAVSLARAIETQQWNSFARASRRPSYSASSIKSAYQMLLAQERAWRELFQAYRWEPLTVDYETIEHNPAKAVARVRRWLGVERPTPVTRRSLPRLERQRDESSSEWARRFRGEEGEWLDLQRGAPPTPTSVEL